MTFHNGLILKAIQRRTSMNEELKKKLIFYLNQLKKEKESAADTVKALIGYTKDKKNQMVLEIQDEVNELKRIIKWLIENE